MSPGTIEKFEGLLQEFSESEQLDLIAYVAAKLKKEHGKRQPLNLAGFLVGKVEPGFDIDSVLREARGEWLREWGGNGIG